MREEEFHQLLEYLPQETPFLTKIFKKPKSNPKNADPHAFHEACEKATPTVTVIHSDFGNVFGGYTTIAWAKQGNWSDDAHAFLFLLR